MNAFIQNQPIIAPYGTTADFSNLNICDEGATRIAEALNNNTPLTALDLGTNRICAEGAARIAEALNNNTPLTALDLRTNRIAMRELPE